MESNEGATLEVLIERILPGGLGLAHAKGLTIFVALPAPGDLVKVRIDRLRGKTAFASIIEVVKPSPERTEPPCPYFGRCGGCDFQQLKYQAQLQAKSAMIRDCLYRIARIENPPEFSVVPSPREWRYRARATWQVDLEKRLVGYYERGTHEVCDVTECAVLVPELQQVLNNVRTNFPDSLPTGRNETSAVAGEDGVSVEPEVAGFKTRDVTRTIGSEKYQFSSGSFFQINHDLLSTLVEAAVAGAKGRSAIDLYCGVGLFTVPLARRFSQVLGIEANASASGYARLNLNNAGLENARVITSRVGEWLTRDRWFVKGVDFLLLDPPRTGAENRVIQSILALHPGRICYVSCDPPTLARDLKDLLAGGYRLESISAFDMFPQTHHVETVVHLRSVSVEASQKRKSVPPRSKTV